MIRGMEKAISEIAALRIEFDRDLRGFPSDFPLYYYQCPQTPVDGETDNNRIYDVSEPAEGGE